MTRARTPVVLGLLAIAATAGSCRKPKEKTPEGTLSLLRDSLATGRPPLDRVADLRLYQEALIVGRTSQDDAIGVTFTDRALRTMLEDIRPHVTPDVALNGARTMLGNGECEKIADAELPQEIRNLPQPRERWQPGVTEFYRGVVRRLQNAFAADFRCEGGGTFRAVFSRPYPDDGTLRVARLRQIAPRP